jgi:quercetin dioxygenase-like cupin family protein
MAEATVSTTPPIHVPDGEGRAFWGPGDRYRFLVTGEQTAGTCFILEALVPPGGGPPPHIHHKEDEFFFLLEGRLRVEVGGRVILAGKGDFVHAPRGVAHTFRNDDDSVARMLAIFTPAGMEGWFEAALDPAPAGSALAPPASAEMIARMLAAGPRFGVEWVMAGA